MKHSAKERLINQISWGHTLIDIPEKSLHFILPPPTVEDKARAAIVYSNAYSKAVEIGMDTENQTIDLAIEIDHWDRKTENVVIPGLRKDIHTIKRGLLDFVFNHTKLESARSLLRRAEAKLVEILTKRNALLFGTAETHALFQQQSHIISRITTLENGDRYWATQEIFDEESDIDLIKNLIAQFFAKSQMAPSIIRELARTDPWRSLWTSTKSIGDIFGCPCANLSVSQKDLIQWSHIYDMVHEAYERPCNKVIEDDDLLDSWFIRQSEQIQSKTNKTHVDDKGSGKGRQEQFIMTDREGAKDIYNINDKRGRATTKAKQKVLSKKGQVSDQHLPESQLEIRQLATNVMRQKMKDISRK